MKTILCIFIFSLALGGCITTTATLTQLKSRAAFDLNCDKEKLEVVDIDNRTKGVQGCEERATYVEDCNTNPWTRIQDCTWVLNTNMQK